jgi:hypothetical protein
MHSVVPIGEHATVGRSTVAAEARAARVPAQRELVRAV